MVLGVRWWRQPPLDPAIGHPFPHLGLAMLAGTPLLTDATLRRHRPTLVNLFASWCVPCRAETPALAALSARGITVAGVAIRDQASDAAAFMAATGIHYAAAGLDLREQVPAALGSSGIPETWLVDGEGIVRARFRGDLRLDDVPQVTAAVAAASP